MKKINTYYWICTFMVTGSQGVGAVFGLISDPASVAVFTKLGYPAYLAPFLGAGELLALLTILLPGFTRLKEWAYAGLAFNVIAAIYSLIATTHSSADLIFPILALSFLFGSYFLYHKRLRLIGMVN